MCITDNCVALFQSKSIYCWSRKSPNKMIQFDFPPPSCPHSMTTKHRCVPAISALTGSVGLTVSEIPPEIVARRVPQIGEPRTLICVSWFDLSSRAIKIRYIDPISFELVKENEVPLPVGALAVRFSKIAVDRAWGSAYSVLVGNESTCVVRISTLPSQGSFFRRLILFVFKFLDLESLKCEALLGSLWHRICAAVIKENYLMILGANGKTIHFVNYPTRPSKQVVLFLQSINFYQNKKKIQSADISRFWTFIVHLLASHNSLR